VVDRAPFDPSRWKGMASVLGGLSDLVKLASLSRDLLRDLPGLAEVLTAPASKVRPAQNALSAADRRPDFGFVVRVAGKDCGDDALFRRSDSPRGQLLKATLATDAVIGAMTSPYLPGSGYVLLHHVMGQIQGIRGAWAYAEGGMGAVSESIARAAAERGAHIVVDAVGAAGGGSVRASATASHERSVRRQPVKRISVDPAQQRTTGVELADGTKITAGVVMSNATPQVTRFSSGRG
jgi:phytoene dehydrogenase-like protein